MLNSILNIIYPKICISCKKSLHAEHSNILICHSCYQDIEFNLPPFCKKCGRQIKTVDKNTNVDICSECQRKNLHFDRNWSVCTYSNTMKNLLHLFKYQNKTALRKPLGEFLVKFIRNFNIPIEEFDFIAPMPLHPTRLREREYNQTQLLTKEISKTVPIKISQNIISRIRNTKPQSYLNAKQRWENIKGAFRINNHKQVSKKNILVIDDLYTTGATASEVALALKNAGARTVCTLTLATSQ